MIGEVGMGEGCGVTFFCRFPPHWHEVQGMMNPQTPLMDQRKPLSIHVKTLLKPYKNITNTLIKPEYPNTLKP